MKREIELKILFAAADRDLLECYKALLDTDFGQTVTAFDGTQVLSLISNEAFDLAVLDEELPRIENKKLLSQIKDKNIPVITLVNGPLDTERQKDDADAYLPYPFNYGQIKTAITDTIHNANKETEEANENE